MQILRQGLVGKLVYPIYGALVLYLKVPDGLLLLPPKYPIFLGEIFLPSFWQFLYCEHSLLQLKDSLQMA